MPLPAPDKNQSKEDWIESCMSNDKMKKEFSDSDQRYAVCMKQWENKNESKGGFEMSNELIKRINMLLKEGYDKDNSNPIVWERVREIAQEVAEEVFGEVDHEAIENMIETIQNEYDPEDTEEAGSIITNMIRGQ